MIAHGCNARGVMASGVAAISTAWPAVKETYQAFWRHYSLRGQSILGLVAGFVAVDNRRQPPHVVANAVTQDNFGRNPECRYVSYDAVDQSMRTVAQQLRGFTKQDTVAIPLIGAGLGNGDWGVIEAILERITKDTGCKFNVYVPEGAVYRSLIRGLRS